MSASDKSTCGSQYIVSFSSNKIGADLCAAFSALAIAIYLHNGLRLLCFVVRPPQHGHNVHPAHLQPTQHMINPAILSTALAAVLVVVTILATWPQPLEEAATLVMVLAQALALSWQMHVPKHFWNDLVARILDAVGLAVAAYAVSDARDKYIQQTGNGFKTMHDPMRAVIMAYVIAGLGFCIATVQQVLYVHDVDANARDWTSCCYRWTVLPIANLLRQVCQLPVGKPGPQAKRAINITISIVFSAAQISISTTTTISAVSTMQGGCEVFSVSKKLSSAALWVGCAHALCILAAIIRQPLPPATQTKRNDLESQSTSVTSTSS